MGGLIPELSEVLPAELQVIDRSTVNAWDDARVADAVRATGRRKLIISGISTEVCLGFPALSATAEDFDAYAAVDASGTFSLAKREAGLFRLQAGVIPIDYATAMVEVLADNADPLANDVYGALDMPLRRPGRPGRGVACEEVGVRRAATGGGSGRACPAHPAVSGR